MLKIASANAQVTATEDQASDHHFTAREPFETEITEGNPTVDQLKSIFEYLGSGKAAQLVKEAASQSDALRKVNENGDNFQRPVLVDWNNYNAVVGDNDLEILKMLKDKPPGS
jgi:arsenate reductase-like glutaredoxin family protein